MSKYQILNSAGITAAIGLASLPAFLTLAPLVAPKGVFADEPTANSDVSGVVALSVGRALAITAENITISATPTVGNTFITTTSTVNVKNTGSGGGYHLIMSSENGGVLKNGSNNINTFSGYSKTGGEMRNTNTSSWGWTTQPVSGTNSKPSTNNGGDLVNIYYPIPTSSTNWNKAQDQTTNAYAYLKNTTDYTDTTSGDNVTVNFGFAIGSDIPAGTYTDTIIYTAVPNRDNRTIFDEKITTMQDLAIYDSACYNTPTPAVRTGNTPDTAVTESVTDMTGYSVGQINIDKIPTRTLTDSRDNNEYTVKKLADGHCWMTTSLKIADETLEPTKSNVAEEFRLPEAVDATEVKNSSTTPYVSDSGSNNTYLYNWIAATAGTGVYATDADAPSDICPKGWQLPNKGGDMSWDKLLSVGQGVYEVSTKEHHIYSNNKVNWGSHSNIVNASSNPLGLQDTGYILNSAFHAPQNYKYGDYWTRTANSDITEAHYLNFYNSFIEPQYTNIYKGYSFAVRCVSR